LNKSKTRRVPLVKQDMLNLPQHLNSSTDFSEVRVPQSLVFCVVFCRSLFLFFCSFPLVIALSVLRLSASDYPFSVFKLFFQVGRRAWSALTNWRMKLGLLEALQLEVGKGKWNNANGVRLVEIGIDLFNVNTL
jgi:hypothetical protein